MLRSLLFLSALLIAVAALAQPTGPMISEVVEGSENNRAIEIFNPTDADINLGDYQLTIYLDGAQVSIHHLQLDNVTLASGDVWVVTNNDSLIPPMQALLDKADQLDTLYPSVTYFTGNDALVLSNTSGNYVDVFGIVGEDPGFGWPDTAGAVASSNHTLVRASSVVAGYPGNPVAWHDSLWLVLPENTFDSLGQHTYDLALNAPEITVAPQLLVFPNPAAHGTTSIISEAPISRVRCHTLQGQQVAVSATGLGTNKTTLQLPTIASQLLIATIELQNGAVIHQRLQVQGR